MIIFHEGLPGAGKSYEAMLKHALPALRAGRKVYARLNGADDPACRQRVCEVAGIPIEQVNALWIPLPEEGLEPAMFASIEDNSFVILDEAQNFWPTGRQKLSPPMTKLITEHRHRGLDFLLMGQLLKDVHATWRGRVDQKVVFNTLDGVGLAKRYSVNVMKAKAPEKFESVLKTTGKYDPAFFGMYRSTVSSDINTTKYVDPRATVWAGWGMKLGIPLALCMACIGFYVAWGFFHPAPIVKPAVAAVEVLAGKPSVVKAEQTPSAAKGVATMREAVLAWSAQYRPRLNASIYTLNKVEVINGYIEWYDSAERLMERQSLLDLKQQGVVVLVSGSTASVGGMLVTAWKPLDPPKRPFGADASNGQPMTTSGRAGLP